MFSGRRERGFREHILAMACKEQASRSGIIVEIPFDVANYNRNGLAHTLTAPARDEELAE